jgi:hypothetical protein
VSGSAALVNDRQIAGVQTKVKVSGEIYYPIIAPDFTVALKTV